MAMLVSLPSRPPPRLLTWLPLVFLALAGCRPPPPQAAMPPPPPPAAWRECWRWQGPGRPVGPAAWCQSGWIAVFEEGTVAALDRTGQPRWVRQVAGNTLTAPLALDDVVVLGDGDGQLVALSLEDGRECWRIAREAAFRHPPLALRMVDGAVRLIALSATDGRLFALDGATGAPLWESESCGRSDGPPLTVDDRIVFGNCEAAVQLFDSRDGARRGRIPVGDTSQMAGGLAAWHGLAYAGTRDGALVAIRLAATNLAWRVAIGSGECFATPAVDAAAGSLLACADEGSLLALDLADGAVRWRRKLADAPLGPPLLHDGLAWLDCDGVLKAVRSTDGATVAAFDFGQPLTTPVAGDGQRVVITADGHVVGLGMGREQADGFDH